jgi:FkbM family methyltransferase
MNKPLYSGIAKTFIDALFRPVKKSSTLLSYIINHTLRTELEERMLKGGIFPMYHIHKSIRLAGRIPVKDFIILDIGGGIGASVILYKKAFPGNKIIVLEPVLQNYEAIRSRIAGLSNITLNNCAAGNENSTAIINIANRITSSSLLPLAADPESEVFDEKNLGQSRSEEIRIVRLDDFLADTPGYIGIMKIDVQGFEMNVLLGAEKVLERTSIVLMEANNHEGYRDSAKYFEIDSFMRDHGFTLYDILPSIYDKGKLKEWDVIYFKD